MLFHSSAYFWLFAATFAIHWGLLRTQRQRNVLLLVASMVFYANWNPWLVLLVLGTAIYSYRMGFWIEAEAAPGRRRALLAAAIAVPLALLAFFKYTNFLAASAWPLARALGADPGPPSFDIVLPLGISFYTFETIAYVTDVYRGRIRAERNPLDYSLFLLFFPHLIAGPIIRPGRFFPQVRSARRLDWSRVEVGARLFLLGLFKKAVIADQLALVVDPVFAAPDAWGSGAVWAAALCYAVQIYCDFSGYSDMAIGSAHALGIKLPANFRMPYFSANPAEFWRRWHISLSTWLRDYLYIPLGGNRYGTGATYRNLFVTMLLGGLWHGAAWTFVAWGAWHGVLLAVHRAIPWPAWTGARALHPFKVAATFLLVCVGWVPFRAQSFGDAATLLEKMFLPTAGAVLDPAVVALVTAILALVLAAHLLASFADLPRLARRLPAPVLGGALAAGLLLVQLLTPDAGGTFIYFQF
jgi:alginate O-acetyltransferase complex protein AlgI